MTDQLRDPPELAELLARAAQHVMTEAEIQAQRESWVRGEAGLWEAEHCVACHREMVAAAIVEGICNRCGARQPPLAP